MIVVGFDVAVHHTHYAITDNKGSVISWGKLYNHQQISALKYEFNINKAYIEEVPFVNNHQTMRKLCEAVGVLKGFLLVNDIPFATIPVSSWKKLAIGSGGATKQEVEKLITLITIMPPDLEQDVYDAAGVALAGYATERLADAVKAVQ